MRIFYFVLVVIFSKGVLAEDKGWFQVGACIYNDIYLLGMDKTKEKHGDISFDRLSKENAFEAGSGFGNRQATLMTTLQFKGESMALSNANLYAKRKCSKVIGFKSSND